MGYTYIMYQKFIFLINFSFFNILILKNKFLFFYYKLNLQLKKKN